MVDTKDVEYLLSRIDSLPWYTMKGGLYGIYDKDFKLIQSYDAVPHIEYAVAAANILPELLEELEHLQRENDDLSDKIERLENILNEVENVCKERPLG